MSCTLPPDSVSDFFCSCAVTPCPCLDAHRAIAACPSPMYELREQQMMSCTASCLTKGMSGMNSRDFLLPCIPFAKATGLS